MMRHLRMKCCEIVRGDICNFLCFSSQDDDLIECGLPVVPNNFILSWETRQWPKRRTHSRHVGKSVLGATGCVGSRAIVCIRDFRDKYLRTLGAKLWDISVPRGVTRRRINCSLPGKWTLLMLKWGIQFIREELDDFAAILLWDKGVFYHEI